MRWPLPSCSTLSLLNKLGTWMQMPLSVYTGVYPLHAPRIEAQM